MLKKNLVFQIKFTLRIHFLSWVYVDLSTYHTMFQWGGGGALHVWFVPRFSTGSFQAKYCRICPTNLFQCNLLTEIGCC